jgi:hypothetical protein
LQMSSGRSADIKELNQVWLRQAQTYDPK